MNKNLKIKDFILILDPNITQLSKNGEEIKYTGCRKNLQMPEKWIDKDIKNHYIFRFKYLNGNGFVNFEFDYFDKFFKMFKE